MNACTQNKCSQGLKECPCPEACELPITMEEPDIWERIVIGAAVLATTAFVVSGFLIFF